MSIDRKCTGFGSLALMLGVLSVGLAAAQEPAPATPPPAPATAPAETPAPPPETVPAQNPDQAVPGAPAAKPAPPAKKGGKVPYTGPMNVVELPPTPMLDAEGKQRLDPDGKPMFNPPVKQQRDKFGHPLFDAEGKPVFQTANDLGYDEKGKKISAKKEKPPKTTAISISHGTLTVDGMIGKAALNYDIADLHYIYLYAPWIGTVVVSNQMFPGATAQANGWNGNTLKVNVEDHTFELYSDKMMLGKKPEPAYVLVDREFKLPSRTPVIGYGPTAKAPYVWPGAKDVKSVADAPPVPESLRPSKMLPPCPAGQMRARTILPGDTAETAPCVPIGSVTQAPAKPAPTATTPSTPPPPAARDLRI